MKYIGWGNKQRVVEAVSADWRLGDSAIWVNDAPMLLSASHQVLENERQALPFAASPGIESLRTWRFAPQQCQSGLAVH